MKADPKYNFTHHSLPSTGQSSDPHFRGPRIKHDKEAWQALKAGDEAAFSYIYNKYIDGLYNYGYHIVSSRELVKDAIQDVFIELNHYKNRLSDVDSVKAYLYVALRRKILDKLKRKRKYTHYPLQDYDESFTVAVSPELNLINNQLAEERGKRLETIINGLSRRQRQAIIYYYYEGFSYKEMAGLLELKTAKSARKLLYRAIATMKKRMTLRRPLLEKILFLLLLLFLF